MRVDKDQAMRLIAHRISDELKTGMLVNLGVGIPTIVSEYIDADKNIQMLAENGVIGSDSSAFSVINSTSKNADENTTAVDPGASYFDSATSFGMIRGGHVDVTVLGTMEVAENGDIANYLIPGKKVAGMGGAMDLCTGCKKVIVASLHTNRDQAKLLKRCTLPLTASKAVNTVVTELGVFDVTEKGFYVREYNPAFTLEEIQTLSEAVLHTDELTKAMDDKYFKEFA